MEDFETWLESIDYIFYNQKMMLRQCKDLILSAEVTDEWLIGALDPLTHEDKTKFMDLVNMECMYKRMGV